MTMRIYTNIPGLVVIVWGDGKVNVLPFAPLGTDLDIEVVYPYEGNFADLMKKAYQAGFRVGTGGDKKDGQS